MIVSMKKVLLLALESDARNALEELRNAGLMQIDQAAQSSNDALLISENRSRAERILAELEKYDVEASENSPYSGKELLDLASAAIERRNSADGEAEKLRRRLVRLEPWGDFKRADIADLEARIAECEAAIGLNASDYIRLQEILEEKSALEAQLEEKTERWLYLCELAERIAAQDANK